MIFKIIVQMLFITLILITPIYSQTNEKIIVKADKIGQENKTGDVVISEITSSYSVIDSKSWQGKVTNLSEIIEKESGVKIRKSGGLGSYSEVSLRGSDSDQVLIYIDGVLLNGAGGGGVDLSSISISNIDKIEIYKGVTPINFGKSSIGGIINIKTKRQNGKFYSSAQVGYGSFETLNGVFSLSQKLGKFDYFLNVDYQESENDFKFYNDKIHKQLTEKRNNSFYQSGNMLLKIGYDLTKDIRFDLSNQLFLKDQNLPNWDNDPSLKVNLSSMREIFSFKYSVNNFLKKGINTRGKIDYLYNKENYDDRYNQIGLGAQHNEYYTGSIGYNHYTEFNSEYSIIRTVFDYKNEYYYSKDLILDSENKKSTRDFLSLAISDTLFLFDETLTVEPALRYSITFDERISDSGSYDSREITHDYLSPQLGVKYSLTENLFVKTNGASYVREPSLFELFGDRGNFIGNDNLTAESGVNFDIGFEYNKKRKKSFINNINYGVTFFGSDIRDAIVHVYDARGIGRALNLSAARIYGVESFISLNFFKSLLIDLKYSWQESEDRGEDDSTNGKRLPGRYNHSLTSKIEFEKNKFKIFAENSFETGIYYDSPNLLASKNRFETSLGSSLNYGSFLYTVEAKNIFNNIHEDFNGYPKPGRSYYFTIKYELKDK